MARMGFFGKLPGVGDFVARGWSAELCAALDRLLQSAMGAAYAETAAHLIEGQAKAIALCVRPGVIAESGLSAILAPSEDRVGRFFPICVGLEAGDDQLTCLPWPARRWTDRMLEQVLGVQVAGLGPDELLNVLPTAEDWQAGYGASMTHLQDDGPQEDSSALPGASVTQWVIPGPLERLSAPRMALCTRLSREAKLLGVVMTEAGAHAQLFADRSAWSWSAFAALFDGRWAHWGWELADDAQDACEGDELDTQPPVS